MSEWEVVEKKEDEGWDTEVEFSVWNFLSVLAIIFSSVALIISILYGRENLFNNGENIITPVTLDKRICGNSWEEYCHRTFGDNYASFKLRDCLGHPMLIPKCEEGKHKICYPPCFSGLSTKNKQALWNIIITDSSAIHKINECWEGYWATHITEGLCKEKGGVWDWE